MSEDKKSGFAEEVANKFIKAIEEGTAPWMKPWKAGEVANTPYNAETGKPYKGMNKLLLAIDQAERGSDDPRYCTYNQAQTIGAQVKKGAKGIKIAVWKTHEDRLERGEDGKPKLDEEGNKQYKKVALDKPQLFNATVFHASDIANMPELPPKLSVPEWQRHEEAEKLIKNSGVPIIHDQADRAFYRPATDSIHLPKPEQFPTQDNYYSTALHELGHATGHPSRLDRDMAHPFGSAGYAKEELKAEITSFMVASEIGIGHDPQRHAGYVENWLKVLKDDPLEIFRASREAEQAKDYLLDLSKEKEQTLNKQFGQIVGELKTALDIDLAKQEKAFEQLVNQVINESKAGITPENLNDLGDAHLVMLEAHRTNANPEQVLLAETLFKKEITDLSLTPEDRKQLGTLADELNVNLNHQEDYLKQRAEQKEHDQSQFSRQLP